MTDIIIVVISLPVGFLKMKAISNSAIQLITQEPTSSAKKSPIDLNLPKQQLIKNKMKIGIIQIHLNDSGLLLNDRKYKPIVRISKKTQTIIFPTLCPFVFIIYLILLIKIQFFASLNCHQTD